MKTVRDILEAKDQAIRSIHPKAMVFEALKLMSEMEIGAVMVLGRFRCKASIHAKPPWKKS